MSPFFIWTRNIVNIDIVILDTIYYSFFKCYCFSGIFEIITGYCKGNITTSFAWNKQNITHADLINKIADIYALPDGKRAELIDGQIYDMAPPSPFHQELVMELSATIRDYIKKNKGNCKVYIAPFAVFLNQDEYNYVEPDISVICDLNKINDKGCNGAPDFVIEVVSPSSQRMDYLTKLFKYRTAGVREYWIVNPLRRTVQVYSFEGPEDSIQYAFEDEIPVAIYKDLKICISDLLNN